MSEINDLTRFNKNAIQLIQARAQMAADKESTERPRESKYILLPLRDIGIILFLNILNYTTRMHTIS